MYILYVIILRYSSQHLIVTLAIMLSGDNYKKIYKNTNLDLHNKFAYLSQTMGKGSVSHKW